MKTDKEMEEYKDEIFLYATIKKINISDPSTIEFENVYYKDTFILNLTGQASKLKLGDRVEVKVIKTN